MSEKEEIKQELESSEEKLSAADALKEYAEEEQAAAEASEASDDKKDKEKDSKKKKHARTPEAEKERALKSVKRRKKFKYGTLAAVITVVVIAIVVAINMICGMLDSRYNWNIDLTSKGLYQIDDQTVDFLHKLNDDIKITVLANESFFLEDADLKVLAETLTRFKTESNGHISVEYIDANKNPEAISVYKKNYSGDLQSGDVVISKDDLVRVIGMSNSGYRTNGPSTYMFNQETSMDYQTYQQTTSLSFIGEQSLVSALMGVTDLNPVTVGMIDMTAGAAIYDQMDAYNYQAIKDLLDKNNYQVESVDIATAELNDTYDLLMLCSPASDLTEAQVQKLTDYLNNDNKYGRNLVYFGSPFKSPDTPNLDAFLALWGLEYGNAIVSESDAASAQVAALAVGAVGGIPVAKPNMETDVNVNYQVSKLPILAPYCCPIKRLYEQNSGRNTHAMLSTSDTCYLYPLSDAAADLDPDKAEKSSYDIAVLSDSTFTGGSDILKSQIIAFGSAWILDIRLAQSAGSYDNSNYFINVMNTVTGKEAAMTIAEKSLDTTSITVSDSQISMIRNVTVFIIPLMVAVIGVIVYIRRKNR